LIDCYIIWVLGSKRTDRKPELEGRWMKGSWEMKIKAREIVNGKVKEEW